MENINMTICMCNSNNTEMLKSVLLNYGIVCHTAETPDKAYDTINNTGSQFLFIDLDFTDGKSFDLLDIINNDSTQSGLFILATSIETSPKMIKKIQLYRIVSFIIKPLTKDTVSTKVNLLLDKFRDHFPARKHVRITPEQDELLTLFFRLKDRKRLSAKIIDISLGGLAFELYTDYESPELTKGGLIEHLIFEVNNKQVDADAKIVNKSGTFMAINFTHFYEKSYEALVKYIMKKVSV